MGTTVSFTDPNGATHRVRELAVVDVDDDGLDDVAVSFSALAGTANEDGVALIRNTPSSGLVLQSGLLLLPPSTPAGLEPRGMDVADLDNDWNLDPALAGAGSASGQATTAGGIAMALGPLDAATPPPLTPVVLVPDLPIIPPPPAGQPQTETAGAVAIHLVELNPPASGPGHPDMVSLHRSVASDTGQVFVFMNSEASPPTFADPGTLGDSGTFATSDQRDLAIGVLENSIPGFDLVCGGISPPPSLTPHAVTTAIDATGAPGTVNLMGLGGITTDPHGLENSPKAFSLGDLDGDGDLDMPC